ncbi:MAG TPA: histidinol-phosphate transaminase, partial [Pseudomonadales bacterium]|nr:histidinol-phosphate transaminase [Pseudomonadales bacterium]
RHGVMRGNIMATRGGDELLRLVMTTFVDPGETIAMTDPTYSLYPVLARIQDCPTLRVPLNPDWSIPADFTDRVNAANAKLTLIVNPHAPSGRLVDPDRIREVAAGINGLLLIDEAYVDFVDPELGYDCVPLIRDFDNVLILRSLSKGYSLAGLRFGYGIASEGLIAPMIGKTRDSYNLDTISQKIAEAAFGDLDWARNTWENVRAERSRLLTALATLGLEVASSQSNFLLATVPPNLGEAEAAYRALKDRGVLVRYFNEDRLRDKLRITVGTPAENTRLLDLLAGIFSPSS